MAGKYGKGCAPDDAHKKTQKDARHLLGVVGARALLLAALPTSTSMRALEAPCFNQISCAGCTGHACEQACYIAVQDGIVGSPLNDYVLARCIGRADPSVKLSDDGAQIADVCAAVSTWGRRPIGPLNPGGNTDVTTGDGGNVNAEPDLSQLVQDSHKLVVGEYRVDVTAPDAIQTVKGLLASGVPLLVGGYVDSAFENYALGAPPLGAPNQADPVGGGHAMVVVGYKTLTVEEAAEYGLQEGDVIFEVLSSWGSGFGDAGHAWVTSAWILALWDVYAFTARQVTS
jgi:hypothetical protein